MKVKSKVVRPVRRSDGSWTAIMEVVEEDVPDRGRHLIMCNRCVSERYPDCIQNCAVEKLSREFEEKMKQEQSESRE